MRMKTGIIGTIVMVILALAMVQCTCNRGPDQPPPKTNPIENQNPPINNTIPIPVRANQETDESGKTALIIEWERPYGNEVAAYSLTVLQAGKTLDDTDSYMWQVLGISDTISRIKYGEVPVGAQLGFGGAARELVPGNYTVQLFAYPDVDVNYGDPSAIIGAGRYTFTIEQ